MTKRLISLLIIIIGVISVFQLSGSALAHDNGNKVKGKIVAIDLGTNTVTIAPKKGGTNVVLNVDSNTKITKGGQLVSLADLKIDDKVEGRYDPNSMLAKSLEVKAQKSNGHKSKGKTEVKGTITNIDLGANTLTINPIKGGAAMTFSVNSSTLFKRGHQWITLSDLTVGEQVEIKYDPNTLLAIEVKVEDHKEEAEVKGTITNIDLGANTITINPKNGGAAMTFSVNSSTIVEKGHQWITLSGLTVGEQVEIKYDPNTLLAIKIKAED